MWRLLVGGRVRGAFIRQAVEARVVEVEAAAGGLLPPAPVRLPTGPPRSVRREPLPGGQVLEAVGVHVKRSTYDRLRAAFEWLCWVDRDISKAGLRTWMRARTVSYAGLSPDERQAVPRTHAPVRGVGQVVRLRFGLAPVELEAVEAAIAADAAASGVLVSRSEFLSRAWEWAADVVEAEKGRPLPPRMGLFKVTADGRIGRGTPRHVQRGRMAPSRLEDPEGEELYLPDPTT